MIRVYFLDELELLDRTQIEDIVSTFIRPLSKCDTSVDSLDEVFYASAGYQSNMNRLNDLLEKHKDDEFTILTNCLYLMDNEYCWNEKENKCELYFIICEEYGFFRINVQDCTNRQIRQGHNIEKMYRAGEFE